MQTAAHSVITTIRSGDVVRIDLTWTRDKKDIKDFSINVSLLTEESGVDIYRVDTSHGYLHEHRFWKSLEPVTIEMNYNKAFLEKKEEVFNNFERWVTLFRKAKWDRYG